MFETLVNGIFWDIALVVFFAGIAWHIISIFRHGLRTDLAESRGSSFTGAIKANISRFFPRREMVPHIRLHVVAGYMFHLGLFIPVLFAAPHIDFIAKHITGFTWTAMPHWSFVVVAQIAFAGLILLWLVRLLNPVSRLISRADDHIATILVFVVMLTGCMALSEAYTGLTLLHRFTVELLMVYFPFSSLMHAILFVPSRGFTGALFGRRGVSA